MAYVGGNDRLEKSHEKPGVSGFLEANHSLRFLMLLTTTSGISYFFYGA